MPLAPGTLLGPYEIVAPLGAGGMGEVYRARDTRLSRDVALKVLPDDLAHDHARLQRFIQEARAVASLNHPNLVAVYDVGEKFFVAELVDGESLRAMGSMSARSAVDIAVQIADGLAAAHAHGVVHRDLKPENIMVTRDGRAKILDFGLAKVAQGPTSPESATLTQEGIVMGTVGYMSPEQVRGQTADVRSDIFSFGLVLYEMLSGRRAFTGLSSIEVMSAILKEDPSDLPAPAPPGLKLIVEHCLEKLPDRRFQSARDLAFALRSLSGSGPALPPPQLPAGKSWTPWAAAAGVLILVAAVAAFWLGKSSSKTAPSVQVAPVTPPAAVAQDPPKPLAVPPAPKAVASVKPVPAKAAAKGSDPAPEGDLPQAAPSASPAVSDAARAAVAEGLSLFNDGKAAESIRHFDEAIKANPDYADAYLGRAGARRNLRQLELSLADCSKMIQLNASDPRGYNCRGFTYLVFQQYEPAVRDLSEAIKMNPNFGIAHEHRGTAYAGLEQYDKAVQDYTDTIRSRPRDPEPLIRRGDAHSNLKQYDKAIQDYTQAIRLNPNLRRAYNGRAAVEQLTGDEAGATADRLRARALRNQK